MGRFVPISYNINVAEKQAPSFTGGKAYYDGKQCWQYKVVYDRPGSYTFNVPTTAICARTVIVGGGGKPKCISLNADGNSSGCNSAAGAGGAYSEKCHAVTGGSTAFTIVVGRQEQDSTVACNSVAVHTAAGASGCIPGAASGGDWNSRGGCVGYSCNNCGSSYSHYCGSQKCLNCTTVCGYCVIYQYTEAGGSSVCCSGNFPGGASAGSFLALCGGASWCVCGSGGGAGCSFIAGGGAGIGSFLEEGCVWHYNCCSCICVFFCDCRPNSICWRTTYPTSSQGGGGTQPFTQTQCRSWSSQSCMYGVWQGGAGGTGATPVAFG